MYPNNLFQVTKHHGPHTTVWFLVGNGGMGYGDYYRGASGTIMGILNPKPKP